MTNNGEDFLDAGCAALDKEDNRLAFTLFSRAVAAGCTGAQHNLAYCYDEGIGIRKNFEKARYWYRKAWKNGSIASASNLALLYAARGDNRQAVAWWRKAVDRGDGNAALDLAKFYLKGGRHGARQKAKELVRRATRDRDITPAGHEEALALSDELKLET